MGETRLRGATQQHGGLTADRPCESVNCSSLLSSSSTVQSSRRKRRRRTCLRLKRTQDSLRTRSSSCGGLSCGIFTADWTDFYIHLSFILVSKQAHGQRGGKCNTTADIDGTQTHKYTAFTREQQSLVMIVRVQCVAHIHLWQVKRSHGKKKGEAASKGTLSHTSKHPFICPLALT